MLLKETQNKISAIRKGAFVKATWKSTKTINGVVYEKTSNGVVRFVHYPNINGVNAKGKGNDNETMVSPFIYHNKNTNNDYIQFATTNIKAKCVYKVNGVMVDKNTYESVVGVSNKKSVVFRVKLENLISLG